jgi:hypothetical protein
MKKTGILCLIGFLSACGVDGEPVQPAGGVNVTLSPNGVGLGANMGLKGVPVRIGLNL